MTDAVREAAFTAWTPAELPWSAWVKPVVFVTAPPEALTPAPTTAPPPEGVEMTALPHGSDRTALVIDLPGALAVRYGLRAAEEGYQPVPLFNSCHGPGAALDLVPLARELYAAAPALAEMRLRPGAPPAFLLDSARMSGGAPAPGRFDNRWLTFPQDFPSASRLLAHGISSAIVLQRGDTPAQDLAHVLLRWKQAGISLEIIAPGESRPRPLLVSPPPLYRKLWYRALAIMGLRRNNVGGFGALVPVATASG